MDAGATSIAMKSSVSKATGGSDVTETTTSATKAESSTTSSTSSDPPFMKYAPDGMSVGAVVGVTLGVLAAVVLIVVGAVIAHSKKKAVKVPAIIFV
jgi:hypothetical protein